MDLHNRLGKFIYAPCIHFIHQPCVAILKINKDLLLQANDDGAFADVLKHYLQSLHEMIYYMEMDDGGLVGRAKSMTVSKQGCCYAQ